MLSLLFHGDFLFCFICHVSSSFPVFENPYPMDIHESPVTCTAYFADCPPDIIPILYSIGAKHKKTGYSQKVGRGNYERGIPLFMHMIVCFGIFVLKNV